MKGRGVGGADKKWKGDFWFCFVACIWKNRQSVGCSNGRFGKINYDYKNRFSKRK